MKTKSLLLVLIMAIPLAGSGPSAPPEEDFSQAFELKTELVFDHHWATVRRMIIRGQGQRSISLGKDLKGGGVRLSPDPQCTTEVLIIAMVDPGNRTFTWWATHHTLQDGKHVSGGAGTPRSFPVKRDKEGHVDLYIQEIVHLNDVSGRHAYAKSSSWGTS